MKVARDEGVSMWLYHSGGRQQLDDGRTVRKYSDELWTACDQRIAISSSLIDACHI